jgi:hypothetical protein
MAAPRADPRPGLAEITAQQQQIHGLLYVCGAEPMLGDPLYTNFLEMIWPYDDRGRLIGEDVWEPDPDGLVRIRRMRRAFISILGRFSYNNQYTAVIWLWGPSNAKVEQLCTNAHWVNESPF